MIHGYYKNKLISRPDAHTELSGRDWWIRFAQGMTFALLVYLCVILWVLYFYYLGANHG